MASNNEDSESVWEKIKRKRIEDPNFVENGKERFKATYSTKILDTPCYRSSILTSVPSGIIGGLVTYLLTSRRLWSLHATFGTFIVVEVVYFQQCYSEYKKKLKQNKEVGEIMDLIVKYRGTEMEEKLRMEYKEKISQMDEKSKFV